MSESILLIGGGGHCKSCIDVIEQEGRFAIAGIVDVPSRVGGKVLGYPIVATDAELPQLARQHWCLIAIGQIRDCSLRLRLFEILGQLGAELPVVVSPKAYVSPHASIAGGTIVMHGAIVNSGARIGHNCIINTRALVEHDAVIGDHCHVSTGAIINGGGQVGTGSFVGSNAVVREYTTVGVECFVGAGVLVAHELASGSKVTL